MTKFYVNPETGQYISSVTADKQGIDLSQYVELVRCKDGILREIHEVEADDRFKWPENDNDLFTE